MATMSPHPAVMVARLRGIEICSSCGARSSSVCSAIEDPDLNRLAEVAVHKELATGQTLCEEGDPAENFYNITGGTVKIFKTLPDGRRQITGFASTGHFLGLAVSSTYAFTAEALEPVRLCRFSRPKLRSMLDDFPALEKRLLETAVNELVAAQEQMLLLGRKTARERVASFLLAMLQQAGACGKLTTSIHLPMSRHDIADYLGLTIETVSRTLTRLKADKIIDMETPSQIGVLRRAELERIAEARD